jgi:hypothetical protein
VLIVGPEQPIELTANGNCPIPAAFVAPNVDDLLHDADAPDLLQANHLVLVAQGHRLQLLPEARQKLLTHSLRGLGVTSRRAGPSS